MAKCMCVYAHVYFSFLAGDSAVPMAEPEEITPTQPQGPVGEEAELVGQLRKVRPDIIILNFNYAPTLLFHLRPSRA